MFCGPVLAPPAYSPRSPRPAAPLCPVALAKGVSPTRPALPLPTSSVFLVHITANLAASNRNLSSPLPARLLLQVNIYVKLIFSPSSPFRLFAYMRTSLLLPTQSQGGIPRLVGVNGASPFLRPFSRILSVNFMASPLAPVPLQTQGLFIFDFTQLVI